MSIPPTDLTKYPSMKERPAYDHCRVDVSTKDAWKKAPRGYTADEGDSALGRRVHGRVLLLHGRRRVAGPPSPVVVWSAHKARVRYDEIVVHGLTCLSVCLCHFIHEYVLIPSAFVVLSRFYCDYVAYCCFYKNKNIFVKIKKKKMKAIGWLKKKNGRINYFYTATLASRENKMKRKRRKECSE